MSNEKQPTFDNDRAATIVGKRILVGLTCLTHNGKLLRRQQLHGKIKSVSPAGGAGHVPVGTEDVKGMHDSCVFYI